MAYPTVRPNDPLDQPSHSGLHNQHATDLEALQAFRELFAGGDAGEVLAKTTNDDYDFDWLPGGTGGGDGGDYPGISSEDPNGLGLGTDGGLRVEPADLLSDNEGQQLKVAADDGKLHMAYDIVDAVPEDDDTTYSIGDVVFVTGPGSGGSPGVGGGKVLQVVSERCAVKASSSSNTYAPTGLTATITPTEATSQILIIVHQTGLAKFNQDIVCQLRLAKDGAGLYVFENGAGGTATSSNNYVGGSGVTYLDSPNTTAPVTYSTDFRSNGTSGSVEVQAVNSGSTITLMEVSA